VTAFEVSVPAKINLHLEVLGRRPDGYHELRTLLQSIDVRDRIAVRAAAQGELLLEVEPAGAVTCGDDNLVVRAARALWDLVDHRPGASILLRKSIPAGAGLGGGSADAAAALVLLDRVWQLDLEPWRLGQLAAGLGSDVPFFLRGGLAYGVGRGDEVLPLPDLETLGVVVVVPAVEVGTGEVYGRLDARLTWHTPGATLSAFVAGWERAPEWSDLRNDLERAVCAGWPEVNRARGAVSRLGALHSGVTGSGAAAFAVMDTVEDAVRAAADLERDGWQAIATRTLARSEATPTPVECDEEDVR
jgi:4-diphosphocytidyl-2-C-methyl-D-erythritol kinase